jgi:hypothetical protein
MVHTTVVLPILRFLLLCLILGLQLLSAKLVHGFIVVDFQSDIRHHSGGERRLLLTVRYVRTKHHPPKSKHAKLDKKSAKNSNNKLNNKKSTFRDQTNIKKINAKTLSSQKESEVDEEEKVRLNSIQRNQQIVTYGDNQDWMAILVLFQTEGDRFTNVNFATAITKLAKIRNNVPTSTITQHALFHAFLQAMEANLRGICSHNEENNSMDPRCYANIVYALAKLNNNDHRNDDDDITIRIFNMVLSDSIVSTYFVENAATRHIANTAWAAAKLGRNLWTEFFAAIDLRSTKAIVATAVTQDIANLAWACAKLGHECPHMFAAIESRAKWLAAYGDPQHIANTVSACAKLGHTAPNLFAAIESRSKSIVSRGSPQEVANTAGACAKLGHSSPELFAAIENQSIRLVEKGNPQEIANLAWACAKLSHPSPGLFAAIETRSKWLVVNGSPQAIANVVWACAKLDHCLPILLQEIENRREWLAIHATKRDRAVIASSCRTLGRRHHLARRP